MIKFINREQLYRQVWSHTMTKIAPKYNLPTYELKKLCDGLLIPLPKVGHWSKIKHGKSVPTPSLPSLFNQLHPYQYTPNSNKTKIKNSPSPKKIQVKKTLQNPHPLITKTKTTLKTIQIDDYGMKRVQRNGINLRTSKANENRALRIMDSIFKWFEKNGATILYPYDNNIHTYIKIENEKIEIYIEEKSKYIGMIEKKYGTYSREVRGYIPTGFLTLTIGPYCCYGSRLRKSFSDGKTKKVEDQISDFIKSVYDHADFKKQKTIERNIQEEAREKVRKEQEYIKQREELEQRMGDELIQDTKNFFQSQQINNYIQEVKKRTAAKYLDQVPPQELLDWLQWAEEYANKLDPLSNDLPKYKLLKA